MLPSLNIPGRESIWAFSAHSSFSTLSSGAQAPHGVTSQLSVLLSVIRHSHLLISARSVQIPVLHSALSDLTYGFPAGQA